MKDKWGRTIDYLRLSLTDRCNLRCRYCMPEALASVGHDAVLRYEEMLLICRAALALGIDRFKITGGEPLVRKGAVAFMKALKEMDGVRSVTLTTNGLLLSEALPDLVRMGIDGINISLDSLDERQYASLTGGGELSVVRQALEQAAAQCVNVKVNAVLLAETRDQILPLAELAGPIPSTCVSSNSCPSASGRPWPAYRKRKPCPSWSGPILTWPRRENGGAMGRLRITRAGICKAVLASLPPIPMPSVRPATACA